MSDQSRRWVMPGTVNLSWMLEQLCRDGERFERERDEARGERDELRAILAPLLDDPFVVLGFGATSTRMCVFCLRHGDHGDDCPSCAAARCSAGSRDRRGAEPRATGVRGRAPADDRRLGRAGAPGRPRRRERRGLAE